ncbi:MULTISPECIES: hypothetical protein [Rhizobium]|nr:hypothetical protein [Rhizobium leguminosarum]
MIVATVRMISRTTIISASRLTLRHPSRGFDGHDAMSRILRVRGDQAVA